MRNVSANCGIAEVSLELSGLESQVETAKNLILSNVSNPAIGKNGATSHCFLTVQP